MQPLIELRMRRQPDQELLLQCLADLGDAAQRAALGFMTDAPHVDVHIVTQLAK